MAHIHRCRTVAAEPEAIWATLADFGSLAGWAATVDHSCVLTPGGGSGEIGLARRVQSGRDTFVETITAFDPPRTLRYAIAGLPRGVSASNCWSLDRADAGTTAVTLTSTVDIAPAWLRPAGERLFARVMAKQSETLLASLAHALEGTT